MDHPGAMAQAQHVARSASVSKQRFDPVFHALMTEVAQKRIAGAQRQKRQRWTLTARGLRIQAIHVLVRSSVATDCDKVPDASAISFAGNFRRLSGSARLRYRCLDAASLQAVQRWGQQLAAASTSRR